MRYYIHKDRCVSCIYVIYNISMYIYIYIFYIYIIRHFAIHMLYIMAHSRDTKTQTDRDARHLRSLQITLFTK